VSEEISEASRWSVDRRVPVTVIAMLAIQTFAIVWWAGSISQRVSSLEESRIMTAPQSDRLTRVEVRLEGVQAGIEDIKRLIRKDP
jgi:hypothetical protein